MENLPRQVPRNATTSRSKVVASPSERSEFLRSSLAGLLRFIRKKRLWPEVQGDLSSWIFFMHGFKEKKPGLEDALEPRYGECAIVEAVKFMDELLGPGMDLRRTEKAMGQSQKISEEKVPGIVEAHRRGTLTGFHSMLSESMSDIVAAWGIPSDISQGMDLSLDRVVKTMRATRATLGCVALHNEHPFVLIPRAQRGHRQAVLDLVKADKLFLHDSSCTGVIRAAELQDDHKFMEQLKRALEYEPRIRLREVQHVYYYILVMIEQQGIPVPALDELWQVLDPVGTEYPSLSAFARDFQRRREDFLKIVSSAEAEVRVADN